MARSTILSLNMLLSFLLTFQSALAVPATRITSPNSLSSLSSPSVTVPGKGPLPSGGKWFSISSDGSQIQPANGPYGKPASSLSLGTQIWQIYLYPYPSAPRPRITEGLFECQYDLFSEVGASVLTRYPGGHYTCKPLSSERFDRLAIRLVPNNFGFNMTFLDIARTISAVGKYVTGERITTFFDFYEYYWTEGKGEEDLRCVLAGSFSGNGTLAVARS